jgi:CubicO group peptidase (beta-lactamase class C family)
MKNRGIPGLSLAVVKDGRLVKSAGYGLANIETATPAKPETVYKIASICKPILATAVALLAQERKLQLDDKAAKYLESAPASWGNITIRHLLSHTSGIVRDPGDYHPYMEQPVTAVIESAYSIPLKFQPGEQWLYSNIGYYVLAEIMTKVSGRPWDEFIKEQLLAPAGMMSTRLTSVQAIVPERASGYQKSGTGLVNAENWSAVRPSGAYLSTVLDLAKWDMFLDSKCPLKASNLAAMKTPVVLNDGKTADYGLGWNVDSYLGRKRVHHGGQFPGFQSDYERFEDDKLSVILLCNLDEVPVERLALKIAGFYSKELLSPTFQVSAKPANDHLSAGKPATIPITVQSGPRTAPDSVVELEIWDESVHAVHKEAKTQQSFAAGESKTYRFEWTPAKQGKYTVNVGVYGPNWTPSYSWNQGMATILVD